MSDEELETWKVDRVRAVQARIDGMEPEKAKQYLREVARYIVSFAGDAGATEWREELHLGDVIDLYIRRSPKLMEASEGWF